MAWSSSLSMIWSSFYVFVHLWRCCIDPNARNMEREPWYKYPVEAYELSGTRILPFVVHIARLKLDLAQELETVTSKRQQPLSRSWKRTQSSCILLQPSYIVYDFQFCCHCQVSTANDQNSKLPEHVINISFIATKGTSGVPLLTGLRW